MLSQSDLKHHETQPYPTLYSQNRVAGTGTSEVEYHVCAPCCAPVREEIEIERVSIDDAEAQTYKDKQKLAKCIGGCGDSRIADPAREVPCANV